MFLGGLDVGTTGCKLTVYDDKGEFCSNYYKEYDVSRVKGAHELDPETVFESVCDVIKRTTENNVKVDAIGVTTFGETFAALDKDDNVLLPAMLYTDPRGGEECRSLCERLGEDKLTSISGVKPHQMFSLPKIMWIKNNLPDVYSKITRILLMEDFIVYKLTGVATLNYALATRTMAFDIRNKCWSKEIFEAAGVDASLMSKPVPSGTVAGSVVPEMAEKLGLSADTKIVNACHDQVAAAVGAGVFEVGQATDGTGTVECITPVFTDIPTDPKYYEDGYNVVPFVFDGTYVCYAFSNTGGAVVKWYRDTFAKYREAKNGNIYAELDSEIPDNPTGILIMPHFAGAATPYMDVDSKAAIIGMSLENTDADFYKAIMEGVTYEMMLNIEHIESCGIVPKQLYATGGGAQSPKWLQIKADVLGRPITALEAKEAGTCGACMVTGVAMGVFKDLYEAKKFFVKECKTYYPDPEKNKIYKKYYDAYRDIYKNVRGIVEKLK